jgi:hypothetical protein
LEPYGGLLIIVHPAGQLLRDGEPANPDIRCCGWRIVTGESILPVIALRK